MSDEIKEMLSDINKTVDEFKTVNATALEGKADNKSIIAIETKLTKLSEAIEGGNETKEKAEKAEKELEEVKEAMKKLELKIKDSQNEVKNHKGETLTADEVKHAELQNDYLHTGNLTTFDKKDEYLAIQKKTLRESVDEDGGFNVTPDLSGRIVEHAYQTSPMRLVASIQAISGLELEGEYDLGQAGAEWVESEMDLTTNTTTPQRSKWKIAVHEMQTLPTITQRLLEDSNVNEEAYLAKKVGQKFGRTENSAFVLGDSAGVPKGFLTYTLGATADTATKTIKKTSSGHATELTTTGLKSAIRGVKSEYRAGAKWFMNDATLGACELLTDGAGNFILTPNFAEKGGYRMLGYDIVIMEDMPDVGADSLSVAFGDMSQAYQIVDRLGTTVQRDPFTKKPLIEYMFRKRVGGAVINFEAITIHVTEA